MRVFERTMPRHLIPIHSDNATNRDWIILLEAGTIVGPSPEKLRVARATLERKVVVKYDIFLQPSHFLVVEGYDPRIHAVYFCPQLYKHNDEKNLVPLHGEEIGRLIAHALEKGVRQRAHWYEPSAKLPDEPIINGSMEPELDSLVVEMPPRKVAASVVATQKSASLAAASASAR
jgi:hypothetical protein